ncbi:MAG: CocE/NonD family hydrolase [Rhodobacteraceae bacterium]|nr:CocE/NonD family hydrolase [Paracoccaceae bacterium]
MKRTIFVLVCGVVVVALALLFLPSGREQLRAAKSYLKFQKYVTQIDGTLYQSNAMIEMQDGVRLATDVYLPHLPAANLPTVLVRLPYGKRRYYEARHWVDLFLPQGFAVVVQDMRGRWRSEGIFAPYPNAAGDGASTLDWIVDQVWSNGQIGTIGCSALGESQIILAATRHPAHRAMIPIGAGGAIGTARNDYGFFGFFEGGIPALASGVGWFASYGGKTSGDMGPPRIDPPSVLTSLPLRDAVATARNNATDFETLLDRFGKSGGFEDWGYISDGDRFDVPTLLIDTWYDQAVQSTLAMADLIAETSTSVQTIIAPGTHCDTEGAFYAGQLGDLPVVGSARKELDDVYVAFMAHHLNGAPSPQLAAFNTYVLGEDRWLESASWPPEGAAKSVWRLSGNRLLTLHQNGEPFSVRSFSSDPQNPVPTLGGAACCTGDPTMRNGPLFQNQIEERQDILLFTSDPVSEPLRIVGPVTARVFVSTDAPDTDLVLRLTDVDPKGRSLLVQEGALRLRYRDGFTNPTLMQLGQIYEVTVRMRDIAWLVKPGHKLRLHIAGSSFPRLSLNMNGGGNPHLETVLNTAMISIHMSADAPSVLTLFTLPD